ncbi:hypothetical protein K2173_015180 [Erythroxylum novogranatense]|uniref:K Homology domain-containing protein n=1 Tax=Erythroxylum novogranatense TaxID=1862640 RepID=A0AAV8T1S6_9ROSI|nr:hypothetical protein K2173_015180 [Erythroxylum novogranatense]
MKDGLVASLLREREKPSWNRPNAEISEAKLRKVNDRDSKLNTERIKINRPSPQHLTLTWKLEVASDKKIAILKKIKGYTRLSGLRFVKLDCREMEPKIGVIFGKYGRNLGNFHGN